jgi:signal peptide peptidase SppA
MPRRLPTSSIWSVPDLAIPTIELYLNRWARMDKLGPSACGDDDGGGERKAKKLRGTPTAGPAGEAQRDGAPLWTESGVAVIEVRGVMIKGGSEWWGECPTDRVGEAVRASMLDPEIFASMMLYDTPGGSVDGLAELADDIKAHAKVKPIVAQVAGMCASAGYYEAACCQKIYAQRMDLVGSIGTRMMLYDWSKLFEKEGLKAIPIDTGEYKSAGAQGTEITKNHQAYFQSIVDVYFKDFFDVVTAGRAAKMSPEQVKKASDGRVWIAHECLTMGLIDGIQTPPQTLAQLRAVVAEQIRQRDLRQGITRRGQALTAP